MKLRESFKHEAQEHVRLHEAQMKQKIHEYQVVIDANHRQSLSSKEQEIFELKRAAEEDRRVQNERINQLEQLVQTQMQHNLKLQSMIDSQFAQAHPPPVVATAATTTHVRTEVAPSAFGDRDYVAPTSKAAPAAKPSMPTPGTSSWTPINPPIFGPSSEMRTGDDDEEILITHLDRNVFKGPLKMKIEPGLEGNRSRPEGMANYGYGMRNARTSRREGSPAPTQTYSPGDTGINTPPEPNDYFGGSGHRPGSDYPGRGW